MTRCVRSLALTLLLVVSVGPALAAEPIGSGSSDDVIALLMDERAINALLNRYIWALDTRDFDAYGKLFEHAAMLSSGGAEIARGEHQAAAMLRHYTKLMPDDTVIRHINSSPVIDVDAVAGTATASSFVTTIRALAGKPAYIYRVARYRDRFEKIDGRWRFASRQELSDWVLEEYTQHYKKDADR